MAKTASSSNYHEVATVDEFKSLMEADLERVSLLSFWAPWAAPCQQMNEVVKSLAEKYETIQVLSVSLLRSGNMDNGCCTDRSLDRSRDC